MRSWQQWLSCLSFLAGGITAFLLFWLLASPYQVEGNSMYPTLEEGDLVLLHRLHLWQGLFKGDVIVFFHPWHKKLLIKRIYAKEGDWVLIRGRKIYVNYRLVKRLPPTLSENFGPVRVPKGKLFVLGDNLEESSDSREGWYVPKEQVVGTVWCRLLPLWRFTFL